MFRFVCGFVVGMVLCLLGAYLCQCFFSPVGPLTQGVLSELDNSNLEATSFHVYTDCVSVWAPPPGFPDSIDVRVGGKRVEGSLNPRERWAIWWKARWVISARESERESRETGTECEALKYLRDRQQKEKCK